jgi:hypothetical protein
MLALRLAALLSLVVWVGGLIALGAVAAPAVFDVVAARQISEGRLLAGAIFGEILNRFTRVGYVCGLVLPISLITRAVLGPRPRRFALRLSLALLMLAAVAYSGFILTPRMEGLQRSVGVAPSALPEGDPRRVEFGRLHGLSSGVLLIPVIGGLLLLVLEMRD